MPRISVIIPTFNRYESLTRAIQSVYNQTCQDFELIVVDDGSTDNTHDIQEKYPSLLYRYQQNLGRSAARNRGLSLARGEYIAFLDSDDLFLPDKLRLQSEFLDKNPAVGMVYVHAETADEAGNLLPRKIRGTLSGQIYPELLTIANTTITTPAVMVRASVLNHVGGFDETLHVCEDLDLWRRIARHYQVGLIPQILVRVTLRTSQPLDVSEYLRARTRYYEKAVAEDDKLPEKFINNLHAEMYRFYGYCAINQGKFRFGNRLMRKSLQFHESICITCCKWGLGYLQRARKVCRNGLFRLRHESKSPKSKIH